MIERKITKEQLKDFSMNELFAFSFAYEGAMGNPGQIKLYTKKDEIIALEFNYAEDEEQFKAFEEKFKVFINKNKDGTPWLLKENVGWKKCEMGFGNYFFIRDEWFGTFKNIAKKMDNAMLDYPCNFYLNYEKVLEQIFKGEKTMKEIRVERKGYGFEPENPIHVREQDLYDYMLALHLDKDSTGKTIQHCSASSSFPVQEKSTEKVRCISVCFQTEIDKLEIYELYFCLEGRGASKKSFLHTQIPEGFKMKAVEVLTVLAQGNSANPVERECVVKSGSGEDLDELFPQAIAECIEAGQASATLLRRRFEIGYPRAARLIDQMENAGFISAPQGLAGRDVYISREEYKNLFGYEPKSITKVVENKRKSMSEDEILKDSLRLVFEEGFIPTASGLRRKYDISYPKAAKVIDKMEDSGYISKQEGCDPRQVLITKNEYLKLIKEGK